MNKPSLERLIEILDKDFLNSKEFKNIPEETLEQLCDWVHKNGIEPELAFKIFSFSNNKVKYARLYLAKLLFQAHYFTAFPPSLLSKDSKKRLENLFLALDIVKKDALIINDFKKDIADLLIVLSSSNSSLLNKTIFIDITNKIESMLPEVIDITVKNIIKIIKNSAPIVKQNPTEQLRKSTQISTFAHLNMFHHKMNDKDFLAICKKCKKMADPEFEASLDLDTKARYLKLKINNSVSRKSKSKSISGKLI